VSRHPSAALGDISERFSPSPRFSERVVLRDNAPKKVASEALPGSTARTSRRAIATCDVVLSRPVPGHVDRRGGVGQAHRHAGRVRNASQSGRFCGGDTAQPCQPSEVHTYVHVERGKGCGAAVWCSQTGGGDWGNRSSSLDAAGAAVTPRSTTWPCLREGKMWPVRGHPLQDIQQDPS
jgi:hypothetical protein